MSKIRFVRFSLPPLAMLVLIIMAASVLRFYWLGSQSLDCEELHTLASSTGHHYRFPSPFKPSLAHPTDVATYRNQLSVPTAWNILPVLSVLERNVQAPLYFLGMALWVQIAGISEYSLRLPGAFLGVVSVLAAYLLGRRLGGEVTGIVTAVLIAFMPVPLYYSGEARTYSLLVLCSTLSTYIVVCNDDEREPCRLVRSDWLYILISVVGLYSHYFYGFVLLSQVSWGVWANRATLTRVRVWLYMTSVIGLSYLPWLWIALKQRVSVDETLGWASRGPEDIAIMASITRRLVELVSIPLPIERLGAGVGVVMLSVGVWRYATTSARYAHLLALSVGIPVVGLGLFDLMLETTVVSVERYYVLIVPILYVFMALSVHIVGRRAGTVLAGVLFILTIDQAVAVAAGLAKRRPDDHAAMVAFIDRQIAPGSRSLVVAAGSTAVPLAFGYYGRQDVAIWRVDFAQREPTRSDFRQVLGSFPSTYDVIWFLRGRPEAEEVRFELEAMKYQRQTEWFRYGHVYIAAFARGSVPSLRPDR